MPNAGLQLRTAEQLGVNAMDGGVGARAASADPSESTGFELNSRSISEFWNL